MPAGRRGPPSPIAKRVSPSQDSHPCLVLVHFFKLANLSTERLTSFILLVFHNKIHSEKFGIINEVALGLTRGALCLRAAPRAAARADIPLGMAGWPSLQTSVPEESGPARDMSYSDHRGVVAGGGALNLCVPVGLWRGDQYANEQASHGERPGLQRV